MCDLASCCHQKCKIKPIAHGSRARERDQGQRSGLGQRGPFEKFVTVSTTRYGQVEANAAPGSHLRRMGAVQSTSLLGNVKVSLS